MTTHESSKWQPKDSLRQSDPILSIDKLPGAKRFAAGVLAVGAALASTAGCGGEKSNASNMETVTGTQVTSTKEVPTPKEVLLPGVTEIGMKALAGSKPEVVKNLTGEPLRKAYAIPEGSFAPGDLAGYATMLAKQTENALMAGCTDSEYESLQRVPKEQFANWPKKIKNKYEDSIIGGAYIGVNWPFETEPLAMACQARKNLAEQMVSTGEVQETINETKDIKLSVDLVSAEGTMDNAVVVFKTGDSITDYTEEQLKAKGMPLHNLKNGRIVLKLENIATDPKTKEVHMEHWKLLDSHVN